MRATLRRLGVLNSPQVWGRRTRLASARGLLAVGVVAVRAGRSKRLGEQPLDARRSVPCRSGDRPQRRHAEVVELAVGEVRPGVAERQPAAADEELRAALRRRRERRDPAGSPSRSPSTKTSKGARAHEPPLVGGDGLEGVHGDGSTAARRVGASAAQARACGCRASSGTGRACCGQRGGSSSAGSGPKTASYSPRSFGSVAMQPRESGAARAHLGGVLERLQRLPPERVDAAVPEVPALAGHVPQGRRVARGRAQALGQRLAVGQALLGRIVAGRARQLAVGRQPRCRRTAAGRAAPRAGRRPRGWSDRAADVERGVLQQAPQLQLGEGHRLVRLARHGGSQRERARAEEQQGPRPHSRSRRAGPAP